MYLFSIGQFDGPLHVRHVVILCHEVELKGYKGHRLANYRPVDLRL